MRIFTLALFLTVPLLFAGCGDSDPNHAPVADAGSDQNVATGSMVTLDGSGSSDRDGDALNYTWGFDSLPSGSTAMLANNNTVLPTFTADLNGSYVLSLVVSDGVLESDADTVTVTAATANSAPVADAGGDQNVATGSTVTLDGSGSSDADLDLLSYRWSLTARPQGSAASLSAATAVAPTFTADVEGAYVAQLIVNDGTADSSPDTVTVTAATANSAPVADAGGDQNVATGSTVTLDGSGSSDADLDLLSYRWSLTARPQGSTASLSAATAVAPTFTADVDGAYVAQLIVNDGTADSSPDTVTVTAATANSAPVADAGGDQNVATGSTVTLDGSGSSDADLDLLSYSWSLTTRPAGSAASLSDAAAVDPTFIADVDGDYVARLVVNDGIEDSSPDTVTITAATVNSVPVADAGADQNVATGSTVTLNGTGSSDADLDLLSYSWSLTTRPAGSAASLSDAAAVDPTFTADVDGAYVAQLIVNDGTADSSPDTVTVTAAVDSAPIANAGDDQSWFTGALVTLDGSGSSDADRDPLSYRWDFVSRPVDSNATLSDPTAFDPIFTADEPGAYVLRLVVNDGFLDSAPDQTQVTILDEPAALGIWQIDEGSGSVVADSSGNDLDGTIVNDPVWIADRAGNDSEALLFDGFNDWVNLPDTVKGKHITLAAWVRISDTSTAERPIFSAEKGSGATGFAYRLQINNGRVRMEAVAPYSTSTARQFTTAEPLTLNVWHHVAGTYDGNDVKVYVDGVVTGTASYATYRELNDDATIPVALGHLENWSVQWFKGEIDDARVYQTALGEDEIAILASP